LAMFEAIDGYEALVIGYDGASVMTSAFPTARNSF